ncbi:MAG: hypothetical protein IJ468_01180 [Lachnospiraceae bacterium]|nr:hypothetical protein [Lachnospiraceae bacterium]
MRGWNCAAAGMIAFVCMGKSCSIPVEQLERELENIFFQYQLSEIDAPEYASCYEAKWYETDEEMLKTLMTMQITGEGDNAFGRTIYAERADVNADAYSREVLTIYENGAESGIYGGFSYALFENNGEASNNYSCQVAVNSWHAGIVEQLYGYENRADFQTNVSLGFKDLQDAVKYIEELNSELTDIDIEVDVVYALDVKTLEEHGKIYVERHPDADAKMAEKEAYLIYGSQIINGIPLVNHKWNESVQNVIAETRIQALISEDGLNQLLMWGAVEVIEEGEEEALLSPQAAEELLIKNLQKQINVTPVYIESMELNYVIYVKKEELQLIPAWIFCIAREKEWEDPDNGELVTIKEYEHFVVNAVTGEQMLTAVE